MARKTRDIDEARSNGAAPTKSDLTRARILDAAAMVLSRRGYAGMRLSDVAEVAEVQAPAIYYYFDSRESLIEEVMWVGLADMREHLVTALDALPPELDRLERILVAVEAHLRHELEVSAYATAVIRNAGQIPEKLRERQLAEEAKYGEIWRALMKHAQDEGAVRADLNPYIAQMLVMGCLNWAAEWWDPKRGTVDQIVENAKSFVRHALAPG